MGLSWPLVGFPLFALVVAVLIGNGSIGTSCGSGSNPDCSVGFNGGGGSSNSSTPTFDCSTNSFTLFGGTPCFTSGLPSNAVVICGNLNAGGCYILPFCPSGFSNNGGMFCNTFLNKVFMAANTRVTLTSGQPGSNQTPFAFLLQFGSLASGDFTGWIVVAIGAVVLLGVSIFGSALGNTESSHIIFEGGCLMILWIFLTGLEGFPSGSPTSFFVGLNGAISGLGSVAYTVLSLVYNISILRTISRSN